MAKTGSLSINSENIFPIIKKWLYSDHDIFYRELVSNGCDAITKLKKLALMGEYEEPDGVEYKVSVTVNPKEKTIQVSDNGLGMTEDEVEEYINQIAFSGAQDFLNKYKDKANEDQIIGHFGLGFYSAFMVADRVTIDTLSYKADARAVHWESEGGTEYEMTDGDKTEAGTTITLYLNDDSTEFANEYRAREVLEKYCAFMPVPIFVDVLKEETEEEKAAAKKAVSGVLKSLSAGIVRKSARSFVTIESAASEGSVTRHLARPFPASMSVRKGESPRPRASIRARTAGLPTAGTKKTSAERPSSSIIPPAKRIGV